VNEKTWDWHGLIHTPETVAAAIAEAWSEGYARAVRDNGSPATLHDLDDVAREFGVDLGDD